MLGTREASKTCLYKHQRFPIFYFKAPDGRWYEYWYQMTMRASHPTLMSWLPAPYDFTATGWRGIVELSTELEFLVLVGKSPEQFWQADQNTNNRCDLVKKWWKPWVLDVVFLSIIILYAIRVYLSGGRG